MITLQFSWSKLVQIRRISDVSSRNATSLTIRPFSASFPPPPDLLENRYLGPIFVRAVQDKRITLPAMSYAAPPVHDLGSPIADADARSHDEVLAIRSYARRMSRKTHSSPKLCSPLELACIDGEQMPPLSTVDVTVTFCLCSHDEYLAQRSIARRSLTRWQNKAKPCSTF